MGLELVRRHGRWAAGALCDLMTEDGLDYFPLLEDPTSWRWWGMAGGGKVNRENQFEKWKMSSSIGPDTGGESSSIVNEGSFKDSVENGFQPFRQLLGAVLGGNLGWQLWILFLWKRPGMKSGRVSNSIWVKFSFTFEEVVNLEKFLTRIGTKLSNELLLRKVIDLYGSL